MIKYFQYPVFLSKSNASFQKLILNLINNIFNFHRRIMYDIIVKRINFNGITNKPFI